MKLVEAEALVSISAASMSAVAPAMRKVCRAIASVCAERLAQK